MIDKKGMYVDDSATNSQRFASTSGRLAVEASGKAAKESGRVIKNVTAAVVVSPMVKHAMITDTELNDPRNKIDVDCMDNVVHLRGHVIEASQKTKAGEIAQRVLKASHCTDTLSNELSVRP